MVPGEGEAERNLPQEQRDEGEREVPAASSETVGRLDAQGDKGLPNVGLDALPASPQRDPDDVLTETVQQLRSFALQASDASGFFPAMYAQVTTAVQERCRAGTFGNPKAMAGFAATFAGYYTGAIADRSRAGRCWQASWNVAHDRNLLIVQHLLLGINAHVNHDLPQTVVAVADRTGDLHSIRADFDAINDVLADTFHGITRRLDRVARWTNGLAALGGGRAFNFSLRAARNQAWAAAVRMHPMGGPPRRAYVRELDELVTVLAYLATRPRFPLSLALPVLRRLEDPDPCRVTEALLAPL